MSAANWDVRNKSSADLQSLVLRDTQVGHTCCLLVGVVTMMLIGEIVVVKWMGLFTVFSGVKQC